MSSTPNTEKPHKFLAHHFSEPSQQESAAKLGMWLFIATEVLFFGGLFMAYWAFRYFYPGTLLAAHEYLDKTLGTINTVVLITSSLTMALALHSAQTGKQRALV